MHEWVRGPRWSEGGFADSRGSSPFVRPLPRRCWSSGHPPTFCAEKKKKRTRVIAAKTSCLLALGRIWEVVIGDSLWWTLLANGLITQQRQSWFMLGNEEVDSGWSTLRLKTYQMFSFRSSERKARLFFHLETFCLTTADLQPRIPWKQRGRARPGSDSQDCTWISLKSFGGVGEDSN